MTHLRTLIFRLHLITGIAIGSIVLVMAVTGVLLAYQRQIQAWADTRGVDAAAPESAPAKLGLEQLLARVRQQQPGIVTGLRWRRGADATVEVLIGRDQVRIVDPWSGATLGDGSQRTRAFFRTVTDVHRWLAFGDVPMGRAITGAANLGFLFMVLSGFYLWWPRTLTARAFRNALMFRRGLRQKARDFNWHRATGAWCLAPLLVIIVSALVTSYGWAGALLERVAAEDQPTHSMEAPARDIDAIAGDPATLNSLLERARAHDPRWRTITMQLPLREGEVTFTIDRGSGGQPHRIDHLTLARHAGDTVEWEPFASLPRAARMRSILRYAHTGEIAGVAGQTLAALASAGAVLLVFTGLSLALRRLDAWRRRRSSARA